MINGNSPKNQAIKEKFVQREIVHCASVMIYELSKNEKYMDELCPVLVQDDWKTPAKEHIYNADMEEIQEIIEFLNLEADKKAGNIEANRKIILDKLKEENNYQDLCYFLLLEPCQNEALEHWIVTEWMAEKLQDHGEMVMELFDFWIWGRCTSVQAILLDGVITDICEDMEILEGQKYEWTI